MRVGRGALLMALALGACSRPGAGTGASDAGAIGPPGRPSTLTLPSCEELLPADLRDLTLNGFTMKEERACPTCGPVCSLRSAALADVSVSVAYDCQPQYTTADVRALLAPTLNAGGEEIPALGRAAARRNPVQGMTQVVAWDDDTPCVVVVTWLGDDPDRAMDVARLAVTSNHGVGEATADAGTELPADAGDSLLPAEPLEPMGSLTAPRAGSPALLSAPSDTRTPPPVPAPRPTVTAPVNPGNARPVVPVVPRPANPTPVAPAPAPQKPVTAVPAPAAQQSAPSAPVPTPATQKPAPSVPVPTPAAQKPAPSAPVPTPAAQKPAPSAPVPTPAAQQPATPAPTLAPAEPKPATPAPTPDAATQKPAPAPTVATAEPKPATPAPTPDAATQKPAPAPTLAPAEPKPATPAPTPDAATQKPAPAPTLAPAEQKPAPAALASGSDDQQPSAPVTTPSAQ
ncbi:hypothetical protein NR800_34300 [Corallococcus interemptor]|uniref:hypothetical protein n=1 Tax=Corallococcus interemptor TaxID=2316720 RepID=UPI0035D44753